MITKKKLLAEINRIEKAFVEFKTNTQIKVKELEEKLESRDAVLEELLKKKEEAKDIITGPEAAKMLGRNTDYVSPTFLDKHDVRYFKDSNGILHIDRASFMDYIEKRETSTNKE